MIWIVLILADLPGFPGARHYVQSGPAFDSHRSAVAWARNYNADAAPLVVELPTGPGQTGPSHYIYDSAPVAREQLGKPAAYPS